MIEKRVGGEQGTTMQNRSNLSDQELVTLAALTLLGLGRVPTSDEVDTVCRWAVDSRAAGGYLDGVLRGVLELRIPIQPTFHAGAWQIIPHLPCEILAGEVIH
jgi:hypothetical protein